MKLIKKNQFIDARGFHVTVDLYLSFAGYHAILTEKSVGYEDSRKISYEQYLAMHKEDYQCEVVHVKALPYTLKHTPEVYAKLPEVPFGQRPFLSVTDIV